MLLLVLVSVRIIAKSLNPLDFGLSDAQSGEERFDVLRRCHEQAKTLGLDVSYIGIDSVMITIPLGAKPIQISKRTDFAGAKLKVANNSQDMFLFILAAEDVKPISIIGGQICKGKTIKELEDIDNCLLLVEDQTPWVAKRKSSGKAFYRKDIITVKNGKLLNAPIASYVTAQSMPKCSYWIISNDKKFFKNLKFVRTNDSNYKTRLIKCLYQYYLEISNIDVYTPPNDVLYGDGIISVQNSCKIRLNEIKIEGSYSKTDVYGYGVTMSGDYDVEIVDMYGHANWGVFYVDNTQKVRLKNCDVNRFDCHCYGKDFELKNSILTGSHSAYGSMFGSITFENCKFNDTDALGLRQGYNANTPFDVYFKNCEFILTQQHECIIRINGLSNEINDREELSRKSFPNLHMKNCKVRLREGQTKWYLFVTGKIRYEGTIDYLKAVDVDGLEVEKQSNLDFASGKINTTDTLSINIRNMYYRETGKQVFLKKATLGNKAVMFCNGREVSGKSHLSIVASCAAPICMIAVMLMLARKSKKDNICKI